MTSPRSVRDRTFASVMMDVMLQMGAACAISTMPIMLLEEEGVAAVMARKVVRTAESNKKSIVVLELPPVVVVAEVDFTPFWEVVEIRFVPAINIMLTPPLAVVVVDSGLTIFDCCREK